MSDPTKPVRRIRRPAVSSPRQPAHQPSEDADAVAEREAIQAEAREAEEAARTAAAAAAEVRSAAPPSGAVRSEIRREGRAVAEPIPAGFEPRDGDVLVVSYPEVTLPLPRQYSTMKFGGAIYSRQLRAGDNVDETLNAIGGWLSRRVEAEGAAKYRRLVAQFLKKDS